MFDDDEDTVWDAPQPTAADFRLLGRIADQRAAILAIVPADRQDEVRRRYLLGLLDRMEESLCVRGHAAAAAEIEAGWTELAAHDAFLGGNGDGEAGAGEPGAGEPREAEPGKYLTEALARVTPEPGEEDPGGEERAVWRDEVVALARRLDELERPLGGRGGDLQAAGGVRPESPGSGLAVIRDAFHAFLPLADPEWWRFHPPRKPNARVRRQLRQLDKQRKRSLRRPAANAEEDFRRWLYDAIALYARAGDRRGLDRCLRLAGDFAAAGAA